MTDHDETHDDLHDWNDVHGLSGAYAVDALDDLERVRFEEHVGRCPDCRAEVDSLREAAAALAIDPVAPPSSLRADVLAGIDAIRPLPPLTPAEASPLQKSRLGEDHRRPWHSGPGPLLVAAVLVLVTVVGTVWLRPWAGDDDATAPTATERVLAAADADRVVHRFPDGSRATVVISRSEGRAVILTEDLALAPEGKDYQLWLQTAQGDLVSAGLMPDQDDATVLLEGDASDATAVGLTVEPDGGSQEPNLPPLALFELAA